MRQLKEAVFFKMLIVASLGLGLLIFYLSELHLLRNHVGDVVAIVFVYSCLTLMLKRVGSIIATTLAVAIGIEFLQSLSLVQHESQFTRLILGQTFDWMDLAVYIVTIMTIASVHLHARKDSPDLI